MSKSTFGTAIAAVLSIITAVTLVFGTMVPDALAKPDDALKDATMTGKMNVSDFSNSHIESADRGTGDIESAGEETTFRVEYYEHYAHDEDGNPTEAGTRLIGERTFDGVVGQEIDAWDYVANIPGFFFFDGWPGSLTLAKDGNDNVIELYYIRLASYSYTVNYYSMTGADLSADTWTGALAGQPRFRLLGSETVGNQLYNSLVDEKDVAIAAPGMYTVGAFPESIRVKTDPTDNVINVLYVPQTDNSPADIEIEESPEVPDEVDGDVTVPDAPDAGEGEDADDDASIPDDDENTSNDGAGADKDDVTDNPSDDITGDNENTSSGDNVTDTDTDNSTGNEESTSSGAGESGAVTDEMLEHPVDKSEAMAQIGAYDKGLADGELLLQTGDEAGVIAIVSALVAAVGVIVIIIAARRQK